MAIDGILFPRKKVYGMLNWKCIQHATKAVDLHEVLEIDGRSRKVSVAESEKTWMEETLKIVLRETSLLPRE